MRQQSSPTTFMMGALVILLIASVRVAIAQQPTATAAVSPVSPASPAAAPSSRTDSSQSDERYRIGPGDVLDIRFLKNPELSRDAVRVDGRGMIRMPMIDDDIRAACLTEGELAKEIATRYLKYKRNPRVDVFVKEYNSQPVAVIGAVTTPSRFQLQRPVRLLELLTFAGGPNARAGARVQIVRSPVSSMCHTAVAETVSPEAIGGLVFFNLNDTLLGAEQSNPYVRPGDIVSIPDADEAFVIGNVLKPTSIPLKEPVTLSRAIAIAGGTLPDSKNDKVRIIRQVSGSMSKTEMIFDLKAINRHQAEDVALQAGDIVDVPTSGGKSLLRSLVGTIAPTVSQVPVRVIR